MSQMSVPETQSVALEQLLSVIIWLKATS